MSRNAFNELEREYVRELGLRDIGKQERGEAKKMRATYEFEIERREDGLACWVWEHHNGNTRLDASMDLTDQEALRLAVELIRAVLKTPEESKAEKAAESAEFNAEMLRDEDRLPMYEYMTRRMG